jgi:hypothetical protein
VISVVRWFVGSYFLRSSYVYALQHYALLSTEDERHVLPSDEENYDSATSTSTFSTTSITANDKFSTDSSTTVWEENDDLATEVMQLS